MHLESTAHQLPEIDDTAPRFDAYLYQVFSSLPPFLTNSTSLESFERALFIGLLYFIPIARSIDATINGDAWSSFR